MCGAVIFVVLPLILEWCVCLLKAFGGVLFFFTQQTGSSSQARTMMTGVLVVVFVAVLASFVGGTCLKIRQAAARKRKKKLLKAKYGGSAVPGALIGAQAANGTAAGGGIELQPFSNPLYRASSSARSTAAPSSEGQAAGHGKNEGSPRRLRFAPRTRRSQSMHSSGRPAGLVTQSDTSRRSSVVGRRTSILAAFTEGEGGDEDTYDFGSGSERSSPTGLR